MGRGRQQVPGASKYAVSKPAAGRGPGSLAGAAVSAGSIGAVGVKPAAGGAGGAGGGAFFSPPANSAPSSSTASSKQQGPGAVLPVKVEAVVPSTGSTGKAGAGISPMSSQPTASRNNIAPDPGGAGDHSDRGASDSARRDSMLKTESSSKSAAVTGKASDHGSAAAGQSASLVTVPCSKESAGSTAVPTQDTESSAALDTTDPKQRGRWSPCD